MREVVRQLLRIQELDQRLSRLRKELEQVPARQEQIRQRLRDREAAWQKAEANWKATQVEIRNLDNEAESARGTVQRLRQQQFEVKTNEAYRALLHEIELWTQKIRQIEDAELEAMERAERLRGQVEAFRKDVEAERKRVEAECAELERRAEAVRSEVEALEAEIRSLEGAVDSKWVERYRRIRAHVGDLALAAVEGGACGGCHMRLPPQSVHDARRGDQITTCAFCGRVLYCPETL